MKKTEYRANFENLEIRSKIKAGKDLYESFSGKFSRRLDFELPMSIHEAYDQATKNGIFESAREMRELIFGKDVHFYGVVYLWDSCNEYCKFCPASVTNRQSVAGSGMVYESKRLIVDEAIKDTMAVVDNGHGVICYLTGELSKADELSPYVREFDKLELDEIILNVGPLPIKEFRKLRAASENTPIQFRVFQETYDRDAYSRMIPRGKKSDYDKRRQSQARALEAGFDDVGIGALFGLHRYPLEEVAGLKKHSEEIEIAYGKRPSRVCLPSANKLEKIPVEIPYYLKRGIYSRDNEQIIDLGEYEKSTLLIYALARLAMPLSNLVSSERDPPGLLDELRAYATCETLNVQPGVGQNAHIFGEESNRIHFKQASVFPRNPELALRKMRKQGYIPILRGDKK